MDKTFGFSLTAAFVALSLSLSAAVHEKPTQRYQDIMKSNAAITSATGLRAHISAKDYNAILMDAATLKANLTTIEAFWTEKKVDDAIAFAKAGVKAATDLETAAKAKNEKGVIRAQRAFGAVCRECHQDHRLLIPAEFRYEIRY